MRRAAGSLVALALLLGAHAAVLATRGALEPEPEPAPMTADVGTSIEVIVVQFHREAAERFLAVYEPMLGALEPDTRVLVVVADEEDRRVFEEARAGWASSARIEYAIAGHTITSWARDRFAVLGGGRILAPPRPQDGAEQRVHDWSVPWTVGRHLRMPVTKAPFRFDGGDLIADDARVYVATPLFERNPRTAPSRLTRQLEETLGRPIVRIGGDDLPVPDHHIGMFLTPLGGGRVAYGDPDLALRALGAREGEPLSLVIDGALLEIDTSRERLQRFRNVAIALSRAGLVAVPIPILPAREHFVFLSYDNVLLDRRADGAHVILPTYGVEALDRAAIEAWEALGARVHPVRVDPVFRYGGSIRCLAAPVVRR